MNLSGSLPSSIRLTASRFLSLSSLASSASRRSPPRMLDSFACSSSIASNRKPPHATCKPRSSKGESCAASSLSRSSAPCNKSQYRPVVSCRTCSFCRKFLSSSLSREIS
eukprot:157974-Hanusia_phi.AAC.3